MKSTLLERVENGEIDWHQLPIEDRDSLNSEWRAKYLTRNNINDEK